MLAIDTVDADLAQHLKTQESMDAEAARIESEINRLAGDVEVVGEVLADIGAYEDKNRREVKCPSGGTMVFGEAWERADVLDDEGEFNPDAPAAAMFAALFSSENALAIKCLHVLRERMQPGLESRASRRVAV